MDSTKSHADPIPVAAYCRVSTLEPSQDDSLEVQQRHWEETIAAHPDWRFAGLYAEKESATHADTRGELMRLIGDCRAGRVKIILTKSISRFSRNTVDCLSLVRALRALGVSVIFEKEQIDTGSMSSELFLSIMASFAAEESRNLSQNVKLGYQHRFRAGQYHYKRPPLGYICPDGDLVVEPTEAATVAEIFDMALSGMRPGPIASELETRGVSTKYNARWTANTVSAILSNLTYTGDALLQKTYKDDAYRSRVNTGQLDRYYIPDHHEAIVSREVFVLVNTALGFANPYEKLLAAEDAAGAEEVRVHVIKAEGRGAAKGGVLRVAAYCRVSTDQEEQESSYEVQCSHYRDLILHHPGWALAGIYADEGISGTSLRKREGFNRMLEDAWAGKIDLILTKSISRFARNTLDCLTVVRKLKAKGIGVTFEKEGLDTLDGTGEVILTILASIAQQESCSISQNIRLGIQYRFQQGIPKVSCNRFLGYDKVRGKLVINEAQAGIVRRIYRDFLDGYSPEMIAGDLRREGVVSGTGCTTWHTSAVRYILTNEKYAGDLLLQKTLVEDFLTHKMVRNRGQLPQYYVENAHPPIVPKSVFQRAGDELFLRSRQGPGGSQKFGSRRALWGRTFCPCGAKMRRLRRHTPAFGCPECAFAMAEDDLKRQVMEAVFALPRHADAVRAMIEQNRAALQAADRTEQALARQREWQLFNLLPCPSPTRFSAECADEADFRSRTARRLVEWSDDAVVRVLDRVVAGEKTVFKGGLEVPAERMESSSFNNKP